MTDWTVDTLKQHVDAEFRHLNAEMTQFQVTHAQIHTTEVEAQRRMAYEMDKKLDEVSEILSRIQQQLLRALPRESFEAEHKELVKTVDELVHWRYTVAGRTVVIVAIVGIMAGLLGVFIGHVLGTG